jgi:hypothetical protein
VKQAADSKVSDRSDTPAKFRQTRLSSFFNAKGASNDLIDAKENQGTWIIIGKLREAI